MARINVSIPDALKERMAPLEGRVNWSEIAKTAFEREISAATFNGENMEDVIERLRVSKQTYEQEQRGDGLKEGRYWARQKASYAELKKLMNLLERVNSGIVRIPDDREFELGGLVDRQLGINPRESFEDSFWFDPHDQLLTVPTNDYVMAFLEGANDVWNEVQDKI